MNTKIVLFDIDYTMFDTQQYKASSLKDFRVFDEVIAVLEEVSQFATIGIFSEGEENFQLAKLMETQIKDYFHDDHVHIFTKKMEQLPGVLKKYQGKSLIFIDDKLEVLHGIKQSDPSVFTIWVKRGVYAEAQTDIAGFQPDAEVLDLKKIGSIIHNRK